MIKKSITSSCLRSWNQQILLLINHLSEWLLINFQLTYWLKLLSKLKWTRVVFHCIKVLVVSFFGCLWCHTVSGLAQCHRLTGRDWRNLLKWEVQSHHHLSNGSHYNCPYLRQKKKKGRHCPLIQEVLMPFTKCSEWENPTRQVSSPPRSHCRRLPLCPLPPFKHHTWAGISVRDLALNMC